MGPALIIEPTAGWQAGDVVGFVVSRRRPGRSRLRRGALVVTCCAADGNALACRWSGRGGATLKPNTWVRVRGTLGRPRSRARPSRRCLAETVEEVSQPNTRICIPDR